MEKLFAAGLAFVSLCLSAQYCLSGDAAHDLMKSVVDQSRITTEDVHITMTLIDSDGKKWTRTGRYYTMKKDAQNDMRLFCFFTPAELADSGVLTIENSSQVHDQWIYLPAFHTIRRIASGSRSEKYMGTDFFYEDIITIKVDEYKMRIISEENYNSEKATVIEALPVSTRLLKESAYSKINWYVDPVKKVILKADFYDKSGHLFKILENANLQSIKGYYLWRQQTMKNVLNPHTTVIEYKNRKIDEPLTSDIFTERYLKRKR